MYLYTKSCLNTFKFGQIYDILFETEEVFESAVRAALRVKIPENVSRASSPYLLSSFFLDSTLSLIPSVLL